MCVHSILDHHAAGQSHILWPGIDGGKWLEMKRQNLLKEFGEEVVRTIYPISSLN